MGRLRYNSTAIQRSDLPGGPEDEISRCKSVFLNYLLEGSSIVACRFDAQLIAYYSN